MRFKYFAILLFVFSSAVVYGQSGGNNTFEFLNLVSPARSAGLGGNAIATHADDVSLALQNPSQLQPYMHRQLSISYVGHEAGIKFGDVIYAHNLNKFGTIAGFLHFVNYGTFKETDETSMEIGSFKASENAVGVTWSKALDSNLYIGTTLKGIFSNMGQGNTSNGVAADVALTYYNPDKLFCATLVAKNFGTQLKKYDGAEKEDLPFEIQAGISKKLLNAPFRFSLIGQQLQKFDITYKDPNQNGIDPLTGENKVENITLGDKLIRHAILNVEVLFTKNFNVRLGYNFLRRKELALSEKKGLAGVTAGVGFKISKFQFSYAKSVYVPFDGSNHFTISTNFGDFLK
jgi:hypothetical protein